MQCIRFTIISDCFGSLINQLVWHWRRAWWEFQCTKLINRRLTKMIYNYRRKPTYKKLIHSTLFHSIKLCWWISGRCMSLFCTTHDNILHFCMTYFLVYLKNNICSNLKRQWYQATFSRIKKWFLNGELHFDFFIHYFHFLSTIWIVGKVLYTEQSILSKSEH